ncbi:MAG: exodeoxyribonuclease VII small subunit [Bradymonadia bacterium]
MAKSTPSYEDSLAEIEEILGAIEGEELPIDELAPKVERAAELLQICRGILADTETRVTDAIDALRGDTIPDEA